MRPALLVLLLIALPLRSSQDFASVLVADSKVLAIFAGVVLDGGSGFRETERAAFLVIDERGTYQCVAWPFGNEHQRHEFRGPIPPFATAIIHTHPKWSRRPSAADVDTAVRVGIPVFVLTPRDIYVATPEGKVVALVQNRLWGAPVAAAGCGTPGR